MKIPFRLLLAFCCILTITLVMGYLIDDLFNRQWYGYIFLGMTLSCVLYTFRVQKKLEPFPDMPLSYRLFFVFLLTLFTCLSIGFLAQRLFDINVYKELLGSALFTGFLNFNTYKTKIKKQ